MRIPGQPTVLPLAALLCVSAVDMLDAQTSHAGSQASHQLTRIISQTFVEAGDTVRVRAMFRNLGDEPLAVSFLPCGVRLSSDGLEFRPLVPPTDCDPEVGYLVSGDSIVSDEAFQIVAAPGNYQVGLLHVVRSEEPVAPQSGGFSFFVMSAEDIRRPLRGRGPGRAETLNYVLGFDADRAPNVSRSDVGDAVRLAVEGHGLAAADRQRFISIEATRTAAEAMLPIPFVLVEPEIREGSRLTEIQVRLIGDTRVDPGWRCSESTGGVLNPVALGSAIAMAVERLLEKFRAGQCPV